MHTFWELSCFGLHRRLRIIPRQNSGGKDLCSNRPEPKQCLETWDYLFHRLGKTETVQHEIITGDAKPIRSSSYLVTQAYLEKTKASINRNDKWRCYQRSKVVKASGAARWYEKRFLLQSYYQEEDRDQRRSIFKGSYTNLIVCRLIARTPNICEAHNRTV